MQRCHTKLPGANYRSAPPARLPSVPRHASTRPEHSRGHARRTAASAMTSVELAQEPGTLVPATLAAQLRPQLHLYDTMTRSKRPFTTRPGLQDTVQMYVCGVTVYDYSHIGHARVYVAFDCLYRLLAQGLLYQVQYIRNFTDIDDKIIARAQQTGEHPLDLASRFMHEFHLDMQALRCLSPTQEPRATDHIQDMVEVIQRIIGNGHAYAVEGGDVYFEVASLPGYGALSGRQLDDNRAGERVAVDGRKRGPADFALWKSAKEGEVSWPSPWGNGRPGWHIECSAMIHKVMGAVIDIHGGGRDLVFPHHENELAQAKAARGSGCCSVPHEAHTPQHQDQHQQHPEHLPSASGVQGVTAAQPEEHFVRYWLHNGFVNIDNEKMSKSLGNFFTIRDVLKSFHPLAMRWFLVSTHYRAPVNYSFAGLEEASSRLYYVYQSLLDALEALAAAGSAGSEAQAAATACTSDLPTFRAALGALLDDLNTPAALSTLSGPLKAINDLLTTKAGRKAADRLGQLSSQQQSISSVLGLLGLLPSQGTAAGAATIDNLHTTLAQLRDKALVRLNMTEQDVQMQIQARADARLAKDFAAADAIRIQLAQRGIALLDTPAGTSWRPAAPSS